MSPRYDKRWSYRSRNWFRWWSIEPEVRALETMHSLATTIPTRARWRRAYRIQRKIQRARLMQIVRAGQVGAIYGCRLLRSVDGRLVEVKQ